MKTLFHSLWTAFLMTLILGLGYPLLLTGLSQVLFPEEANGSLVRGASGQVVGSSLIGQDWSSSALWFQGRPSATGGSAYNAMASGGSNLTPHGDVYTQRIEATRLAWGSRGVEAGQTAGLPQGLVTASGSGLDPHLDLASALWQVPLVAYARGADPAAVETLVRRHIVPTGWPWDPEPFVNVLEVNQDLDQAFPRP